MSKRNPVPAAIDPDQIRVAIYARKSDADEGQNKSRRQQVAHCQQSVEALGWPAVPEDRVYAEEDGVKGHWWWDDGSGRNPGPHRPQLSRLMSDVDAGLIDLVLVWRTDRLYRDAGVADALLKNLVSKGVRLYARTQDYAIHTAGGFQSAMTEASANRGWRDRIGEDVARDHDDKARLGMFTRDPSCFGFRSKGRGTQAVEPQDDELAIVNRIFRLFVGEEEEGALGISGICKNLMDEGISLAVGAKGHIAKNHRRIHTSQVRTILENPMYVGRWRHDGREYKCDRLLIKDAEGEEDRTAVPLALFEAAQERLNSLPRHGRKALSSQHLLTGVAVCGCCGRPLQVNNRRRKDGSTRRTFFCNRVRDTIPCSREGMANLLEDQLDAWVTAHLAPWILSEVRALREADSASAERNRLAEVRRQLAAARTRETDQLAAALGALDSEQIMMLAARLRGEREQLERSEAQLSKIVDREQTLPFDDLDLTNLSRSAAKAAVRSAVRWIAVTAKGVVALTQWGSYVGGELVPAKPTAWNAPEARRAILPPTLASCVECITWIPCPEKFVLGRRFVLGDRAARLSDEALLPGAWPGCVQEFKCA